MEGWRLALCEGYELTKAKADRSIESLRNKLHHVLRRLRCEMCGSMILDGDLLDLGCITNVPHLHCFDCLRDVSERQKGHIEKYIPASVQESYPLLNHIVLCTKCHLPAVIHQSSAFVTGFAQKQSAAGGRVQFKLDRSATTALRQHAKLAEYYQNQRRGPFGKFKSKLLITDKRTTESTKDGQPINLRALEHLEPNEVWLNEWRWDSNVGDPQGWQYAFNWPGTGFITMGDWVNAPSGTTFVRRRRMLRTKVHLIDELKVSASPAGGLDGSPLATASKFRDGSAVSWQTPTGGTGTRGDESSSLPTPRSSGALARSTDSLSASAFHAAQT